MTKNIDNLQIIYILRLIYGNKFYNVWTFHVRKTKPGAAEGVEDWSDHLRKTSTRQLLDRPKF